MTKTKHVVVNYKTWLKIRSYRRFKKDIDTKEPLAVTVERIVNAYDDDLEDYKVE